MNFILKVQKPCFYHSPLAVFYAVVFHYENTEENGFIKHKQSLGAKVFHMLMIILAVSPEALGSVQSFILSPTTQIPQQGGSVRWTITDVPPVQRSPPTLRSCRDGGWHIWWTSDRNPHLNFLTLNICRGTQTKENTGSFPSRAKYSKCLNFF